MEMPGLEETEDGTDAGLSGWTVQLQTTSGTVLQTTTTTSGGTYAFANLGPGSYRLREVLPLGWTQSTTRREETSSKPRS